MIPCPNSCCTDTLRPSPKRLRSGSVWIRESKMSSSLANIRKPRSFTTILWLDSSRHRLHPLFLQTWHLETPVPSGVPAKVRNYGRGLSWQVSRTLVTDALLQRGLSLELHHN